LGIGARNLNILSHESALLLCGVLAKRERLGIFSWMRDENLGGKIGLIFITVVTFCSWEADDANAVGS
jgi:hypothetical protein